MLGMRSTYYLAKHILGYDKLSPGVHMELCDHYDKYFFVSQFIQIPRKHYKTTLTTITGNARHVLVNPDISIAIMFDSMDHLKDVMREIKDHFIKNDKFRDLYPEHAVKQISQEGPFDRFITPARKGVVRMPTLTGYSVDKSVVSAHFDLMHFDDIVNEKNSKSRELLDKVWDVYSQSLITASTNHEGFKWNNVVGTPWDFFDTYARILESNTITGEYHVFHRSAEWNTTDEEENKTHHVLFPEQWNMDQLDAERRRLGDYAYSCQYLCTPVAEGQAAMDPDKLCFYDENIKIATPLNKCITVDPAASIERKKGDPTVIAAWSIDPESNIRLIEMRRDWWDVDDLIDEILAVHKLHAIREIGIEAVSFQSWLCHILERKKKETGFNFKVIPIKRSRHIKKKDQGGRQERIIGYLNEGKIHIRKTEPEIDIIKRELREYPHGRYDDFMDTLTDAIELLRPPGVAKKSKYPYRMPPYQQDGRRGFQTGYGSYSNNS